MVSKKLFTRKKHLRNRIKKRTPSKKTKVVPNIVPKVDPKKVKDPKKAQAPLASITKLTRSNKVSASSRSHGTGAGASAGTGSSKRQTGPQRIVLVANNRGKVPNFDKFPIKLGPNDLLVRFNTGLYRGTVPKDVPQEVYFRTTHRGALGTDSSGKIRNRTLREARAYYLVGPNKSLKRNLERVNKIKVESLSTGKIRAQYKLGHTPSTGFVALVNYLKAIGPGDQIYLFGFSWQGWSGHNFKKERTLARQWIKEGKLYFVPS